MQFTEITNKQEFVIQETKFKEPGPINDVPSEMVMEIFSYFGLVDLLRASNTCQYWKKVEAQNNLLNRCVYNSIAFGKDKWIKYFGKGVVKNDQEDFKALPKDIVKILLTCIPDSKEKVMDSHVLVWVPKQIKGEELTLITIGKLVKEKCFPETEKGFDYINSDIMNEHGKNSVKESYWVLMTKDVLPGSRKQSYDTQKGLVKQFAEKTEIAYGVPNMLEAIVCIFAEYIRTDDKIRLFSDEHRTYTRCQEQVGKFRVHVGGFAPSGLYVSSHYDHDISGVAALRKFFLGHWS